MTTEEAIQNLEEARKYPVAYSEQEQEAYEMAFAALRAQKNPLDRSMWGGCHICNSEFPIWYLIGCHEDYEPEFCPNCGKPRTEQAWAEMERRINGGKTD